MAYMGMVLLVIAFTQTESQNGLTDSAYAREIGFVHPRSGKYFEFKSDLPEYFIKLLNSIR